MQSSTPKENHDAFAPPPGGLSASLALGLAVAIFPVLATANYQFGVMVFRWSKFWWPALDAPSTLIAFAFSAAVLLMGFWYFTRPERSNMLRGLMATVLGSCGVFFVFWPLLIIGRQGIAEISLAEAEIQLLVLGVVANIGAGLILVLGMTKRQ